jgi:hypothetical protein
VDNQHPFSDPIIIFLALIQGLTRIAVALIARRK